MRNARELERFSLPPAFLRRSKSLELQKEPPAQGVQELTVPKPVLHRYRTVALYVYRDLNLRYIPDVNYENKR